MGKFSELRNIRNSVILEVSGGEYRANFAEIEKGSVIQENVNSELDIVDKSAWDIDEKLIAEENKLCDNVSNIKKETKMDKFRTIRKKLTDVFAMLQRPKRKPLREFFIDEEEELESKCTSILVS